MEHNDTICQRIGTAGLRLDNIGHPQDHPIQHQYPTPAILPLQCKALPLQAKIPDNNLLFKRVGSLLLQRSSCYLITFKKLVPRRQFEFLGSVVLIISLSLFEKFPPEGSVYPMGYTTNRVDCNRNFCSSTPRRNPNPKPMIAFARGHLGF
ncbi:hypothetical protein QQP08_006059 [Theobroma cacao]|nr:hypothetical protein QQP08_006059 [Theobroma cacao]